MLIYIVILATLITYCGTTNAQSQDTDVGDRLVYRVTGEAQESERVGIKSVYSVERVISLAQPLVAGSIVRFDFPGIDPLPIRIRDIGQTALGSNYWIGNVEGVTGTYIQIVRCEGVLVAEFSHPDLGQWSLYLPAGQPGELRERDPNTALRCGTWTPPVVEAGEGSLSPPSEGLPVNVDAIAYYTEGARQQAGGTSAIRAAIESAFVFTNEAMEMSDSGTRVTLRDIMPIDPAYVPVNSLQDMLEDVLDENISLAPGELGVPDARADWVGADLITYFAEHPGGPYSGIAQRLTNDPFGCPAPFYKSRNSVSVWDRVDTVAHEIGHNYGNGHGPSDPSGGGGADPYSEGYTFTGNSGSNRTLMAYGTETRIPYFSNPSIIFDGVPIGVPDVADNARSMRENADCVSQFTDRSVTEFQRVGLDSNPGRINPNDPNGPLIYDSGFGTVMDADGNWFVVGHPHHGAAGHNSGSVYLVGIQNQGIGGYSITRRWGFNLDFNEQMKYTGLGRHAAISGTRMVASAYPLGSGTTQLRVYRDDGGWDLESTFNVPSGWYLDDLQMHKDLIFARFQSACWVFRRNSSSGNWELEYTFIESSSYGSEAALGDNMLVIGIHRTSTPQQPGQSSWWGPVIHRYDPLTGQWFRESLWMAKPHSGSGSPIWGVAFDGNRVAVGRGSRTDGTVLGGPDDERQFGLDIWRFNPDAPAAQAWQLEAGFDVTDNYGATDISGTPQPWRVSPGQVAIDRGLAVISNWWTGPGYRVGAVHTFTFDDVTETWVRGEDVTGDGEYDEFGWQVDVASPGILVTAYSWSDQPNQRLELWVRRDTPRLSPCSLEVVSQPQDSTMNATNAAVVSVVAQTQSAGSLQYQWYYNGYILEDGTFSGGSGSGAGTASGTNSPTLTIVGTPGYSAAFAGDVFTCEVTAAGCVEVTDPVAIRCAADMNADGVILPSDFTAWIAGYNAGDLGADQNIDGALTPADFTAWISNYNAGC